MNITTINSFFRCQYLFLLALFCNALANAAEPAATTLDKLRALDESTRGELGVYVKNLNTGEEIAYNAERKWYLASLMKIPLAIAVLQAVENKQLALDDELVLQQSDFADGSSIFADLGSRHGIGDLLKRSLQDNDITATNMLLRKLGVDNFNQQTRRNVGANLGPFNTVLPERNHGKNLNTGTLRAMGTLMERLGRGELIDTKHTDLLLSHMENATSGDKRLHSGTQLKRACNLGINNPRDLSKSVVIVVCAEGFAELEHAEKSFTSIATILVADGRVP